MENAFAPETHRYSPEYESPSIESDVIRREEECIGGQPEQDGQGRDAERGAQLTLPTFA